jgi:hypothetical protein
VILSELATYIRNRDIGKILPQMNAGGDLDKEIRGRMGKIVDPKRAGRDGGIKV